MTDTSRKSFLIDSNILVYALDKASPYYKKVIKFFEWSEENSILLVITHQNILEVINTLSIDYKKDLSVTLRNVRNLISQEIFEIIFPTIRTIDTFFDLNKNYHSLRRSITFDLYLTATAMDNGIKAIITNNRKDFEGIRDFEVYGLEDIEKIIDTVVVNGAD